MRNSHWDDLLAMSLGEKLSYSPVGFIIDSPWLPGWHGISTIDYYSSDDLWLKANLDAAGTFPEVWFMPGFWSEYGMCTEPSAFGSRMVFSADSLPHASRVLHDISDADELALPDVRTDGLLPFMINRLRLMRNKIREADHEIRFAVSRGPMNIASFLMGTTELMLALAIDREGVHRLIKKITSFICNWIEYQKECFNSIEGIFILDDLIGFVGEQEFSEFVTPYMEKIFKTFDAGIRFLHNDADGIVTASHLGEMNVNVFNFSFNHTISEIRKLAGDEVILVGNIPPRDVMASGNGEDVTEAVKNAMRDTDNHDRVIWSVGGGMPPDVSGGNIRSFIDAVNEYSK